MTENFEIEIIDRMSKAEIKIDNIEKQVGDMSDMKTTMIRSTIIQEQQLEQSKKMQDMLEKQLDINEKQFQTNVEMTNTLKIINENMQLMKDEIKGVKCDIAQSNIKINDVAEDVSKNNKKINNKMDDFENKFESFQKEKNYIKIDKTKLFEFIKNNYKKILIGLGSILGVTGMAKANQIIEFIQSLIG